MAKQLFCSRCGKYQGEIVKGRLAKSARVICEDCDDRHISDELTEKAICGLVDMSMFRRKFSQVTA